MKRLLLAVCAVLALSVGSAQAQSTLTAWQGSVTITALAPNANCKGKGFEVGNLFHAMYRAKLDVGDPNAGLSIITSRSATIIFDQTGSSTMKAGANASYHGYLIGGHVTTTTNNAAYTGTYTFNVLPLTITASTNQVTLSGTITNFFNTTGCSAKIEGSFFQRVD